MCVGVVVNLVVDLVLGELEFKYMLVVIEEFCVGWYGFIFMCYVLDLDDIIYWICV